MKRVILSLFVAIAIFLFLNNASALVGITPPAYILDFEPGLQRTFKFTFMTDTNLELKLGIDGDLAEYAELNKNSISGVEDVEVTIKLPEKIDVPGPHLLYVSAQQPDPERQGFSLIGRVKGVIKINVPYPEQYAILSLESPGVNTGDPIEFTLSIHSLGEQSVITAPFIEIFDKANTDEYLARLQFPLTKVEPRETKILKKEMETSSFKPGLYLAVATAEYLNRKATVNSTFRLGELYLNITSYSNNFKKDSLNKFDIGLESFWKEPLKGVYAEVTILDTPVSFITPTKDIEGFGTQTLTGFFDTSQIKENNFKAKIVVYYADKTTEKIVDLNFKKEIDYVFYGITLAFIILIGIIIWLVFRQKKLNKKNHKRK